MDHVKLRLSHFVEVWVENREGNWLPRWRLEARLNLEDRRTFATVEGRFQCLQQREDLVIIIFITFYITFWLLTIINEFNKEFVRFWNLFRITMNSDPKMAKSFSWRIFHFHERDPIMTTCIASFQFCDIIQFSEYPMSHELFLPIELQHRSHSTIRSRTQDLHNCSLVPSQRLLPRILFQWIFAEFNMAMSILSPMLIMGLRFDVMFPLMLTAVVLTVILSVPFSRTRMLGYFVQSWYTSFPMVTAILINGFDWLHFGMAFLFSVGLWSLSTQWICERFGYKMMTRSRFSFR